MPVMKGLLAPQNTFLDSIANHFDGTRKYLWIQCMSYIYIYLYVVAHIKFVEHTKKILVSLEMMSSNVPVVSFLSPVYSDFWILSCFSKLNVVDAESCK